MQATENPIYLFIYLFIYHYFLMLALFPQVLLHVSLQSFHCILLSDPPELSKNRKETNYFESKPGINNKLSTLNVIIADVKYLPMLNIR